MPEEKQKLNQEELLMEIYEKVNKLHKHMMWSRVFSILKILIIIIPIILAIIYLPPMLENVFAPYKELLNTTQQGKEMLQGFDINSLLKMYK